MQNKNKAFNTSIVSLESVDQYSFYIPTYQRPYVWGEEQLKKLLDDFFISYKNNPNEEYYISTFLTKEENNQAELIDGQQRFTSLWLISFVLSRLCPSSKISNFLKKDNQLRLSFEIRTEVKYFLTHLLNEEKNINQIKDEAFVEAHPYLKNIAKALVFIQNYIIQHSDLDADNLIEFGNFIYQKVHLVKNTTPEYTDLNKLFSTINSAGVQLEQTDIVKSNLLKLVNEKVKFGKIWESCENMSNFFERNARVSFSATNWTSINLNKLIAFDDTIFKYQTETLLESNNERFTIDDLNIENLDYKEDKKGDWDEKNRTSENIYCRSIINFGQLLLHTYRLHLHREQLEDFEGTFHVSRLIEIFKPLVNRKDSEEIKRFFYLLWEVRFLFDKYIIKWISDSETKNETLELVNFNLSSDSYYSRSEYEKSSSLMLQSVLYFTGDYLRQYWLTSYLGYLLYSHQNFPATHEVHLNYLEKIDNTFSLNNNLTDKELSWLLLGSTFISQNTDVKIYLNHAHGTRFKHYWFFKLEYVLWKNWKDRQDEKFKQYRITSKNSIEHIYPQNPDSSNTPKLDDEYLHSFGNLVLLSVSQNSEYSNKSIRIKQTMFNEKRDVYDSLKSYYIFKNLNNLQNQDEIKKNIFSHKDEIIEILLEHYSTKIS